MPDDLPYSFLIKKANIELKVTLQPNRRVSMEPHQCKPENMRLCNSIAQVQNTMAQLHLEANMQASPYTLLLSVFDSQGWMIETDNEPRK